MRMRSRRHRRKRKKPAGESRKPNRGLRGTSRSLASACTPQSARPDIFISSEKRAAMARALRAYEKLDLGRKLDREVWRLLQSPAKRDG
jgi:hypothetical protein